MKITTEQIAKVVHEINKAFCEQIGDHTLVAWEETPQDIKDVVIGGVQFHIDNPDAGPDASHNNWMAAKIAQGWTYGPVKNAPTKQHPCIVPFEQLSLNDRIKDVLVMQTVHSLKGMNNPLLEVGQEFTIETVKGVVITASVLQIDNK